MKNRYCNSQVMELHFLFLDYVSFMFRKKGEWEGRNQGSLLNPDG